MKMALVALLIVALLITTASSVVTASGKRIELTHYSTIQPLKFVSPLDVYILTDNSDGTEYLAIPGIGIVRLGK